jgi:hypothetical protein
MRKAMMVKVRMVRSSLPVLCEPSWAGPRWTSRALTSRQSAKSPWLTVCSPNVWSGMLRCSHCGICRLMVSTSVPSRSRT